jgi:hypothetical protein
VCGGQVREPECHAEVHQGRFINLQRLVLHPSALGLKLRAAAAVAQAAGQEPALVKVGECASTVELAPLHPCAAVTLELLQTQSFDALSISFTPRDAFALYESLAKHCRDASVVADLAPATFFAQFGDPQRHQITLAQAKEYEQAIKAKLETMAKIPALGDTVRWQGLQHTPSLASFLVFLVILYYFFVFFCLVLVCLLRAATAPVSPLPCEQVRAVLADFAMDEETLETTSTRLFEFAVKCRDEALFPCLCFQLNSCKCLDMFKELLGQLESRQLLEYPNYYEDLIKQAELEKRKAAKAAESGKRTKKKDEDGERPERDGKPEAQEQQSFIDTAAPHPNYVLSPPNARISAMEFDDILKEMVKDKEPLLPNHPLARGLRRGLGLYIDDVGLSVYRRVVQRLAQEGKLAVVFSDHSLAYGVNMPFRTCAFCGDMGGLLTPLMAQQMSGRTGRRGLDTQGNIVYLGMKGPDIKGLILGKIPDIVGGGSQYPTMALQHVLSDFVDLRAARNAARPSFAHFQQLQAATGDGAGFSYFDMSCRLLQELGLVDVDMKPATAFTGLTTCFELRTFGVAESLAVLDALPLFMKDFVTHKPEKYSENVGALKGKAVVLYLFCLLIVLFFVFLLP